MPKTCFVIFAIAAALSGCAQNHYYPASDTTASGITVFGEIDASVEHHR
ncbi:hypothetical protein [Comamonas sp. NoAH]|nr:hypothetical protein [Comamonas sp. NoAH]